MDTCAIHLIRVDIGFCVLCVHAPVAILYQSLAYGHVGDLHVNQ